jgi:hypothetical protein
MLDPVVAVVVVGEAATLAGDVVGGAVVGAPGPLATEVIAKLGAHRCNGLARFVHQGDGFGLVAFFCHPIECRVGGDVSC